MTLGQGPSGNLNMRGSPKPPKTHYFSISFHEETELFVLHHLVAGESKKSARASLHFEVQRWLLPSQSPPKKKKKNATSWHAPSALRVITEPLGMRCRPYLWIGKLQCGIFCHGTCGVDVCNLHHGVVHLSKHLTTGNWEDLQVHFAQHTPQH